MIRVAALVLSILLLGVAHAQEGAKDGFITISSTTSTEDSACLVIIPLFRSASGVDVHVVAVGTGQALIGMRGDADARGA